MNEKIRKRFDREMQISYNLNFIKQCCTVAGMYLKGIYEVNDLEELIVDLCNIEDNVKEIEKIFFEIEQDYEEEIEVLKNE